MTDQLEIPLGLSAFTLELVRRELVALANDQQYFTADDLVARLSPGVRDTLRVHPGAIGALVKAAARAGVIVDANRTIRSQREGRRAARIVVWTGGDGRARA